MTVKEEIVMLNRQAAAIRQARIDMEVELEEIEQEAEFGREPKAPIINSEQYQHIYRVLFNAEIAAGLELKRAKYDWQRAIAQTELQLALNAKKALSEIWEAAE